jgi:2-iminobutanoate/2-iminopropanoate deaminase
MPAQRSVIAPPVAGLDLGRTLGVPMSTLVAGGELIFVAGLIAVDPATGERRPGTVASETKQIFENLKEMLEAAGSSLDRVVKITAILHSMLEAPSLNEVCQKVFPDSPPARTVCGARLPDGVKVMIECTALRADASAPAEKLLRSIVQPRNPVLNVSRNANLPHSPGVRAGDYIFLSGMGPVDPETGERRHGPIGEQVRITLTNMRHMLESAGSSLKRILRVHVVLANIADMPEMERVYAEFFGENPPVRMAWSMQLRFGNGCEIECVALAGE